MFKDENYQEIARFHNDFTGINKIIDNYQLVAYNNYHYDDPILTRMLAGWSPTQLKALNDNIIVHKQDHKRNIYSGIKNSLDTMQQINVTPVSLKQIEGNMGKAIVESKVSFKIERPLTDAEIADTWHYNAVDVDSVIDIYKLRKKRYFEAKKRLIEMLPPTTRDLAHRWNTTTIVANILSDKPVDKWASIRVPDHIMALAPPEVRDMWVEHTAFALSKGKKPTMTIRDMGVDTVFGFGGLHAAPSGYQEFSNVILYDVASMYPSIIILLNALGVSTKVYAEIKEKRLEAKARGDEDMDAPLKLILNSTYGLMNNEYSMMYNPLALYTVVIYGQISLYTLMKMIAPHGQIVQGNTDGVAYVPHSKQDEEYVRNVIIPKWEEQFQLTMEEQHFDKFFQRDVNNYIAIQDIKKGIVKDNVTLKGGDVKKAIYNDFFGNNSIRIVDVAIAEYLVNGKDVLSTLQENIHNPLLFQYILKGGSTFVAIRDDNGNEYQKVNRVFAVKENIPHVLLRKYRVDGTFTRFPDAPDRMLVWNEGVDELNYLKEIVDWNFYYTLINKKLEKWR